ncbi:MAG: medium chain dehydrogenase/reductase family protein [Proteobacteria bacterium]|nr:medium chain dehydrogenase/reductase family protein [Pseudomonadota bacterium]
MRQVWIPRAGSPEVLELREAPDPLPAAGEVRIRVEASGVNFADIMGRLGIYPDLPAMPVVPGYEVAGRIDAVGDGVETDWIGRDVLAMTRFGGYADVVCVLEAQAYARPEELSVAEAAGLPVNYLTAFQLIEVMGSLRTGETVLVHSAGGGVGIAAVQLAKRIGARVIGTASASKHDFLKSLGVDECIDYTCEDFEARVLDITHGRGVELVLDAVGGKSFKKSYRSLAPTGRLGMFGISAAATGKRRSLTSLAVTLLGTPWLQFTPLALMNANKGVFGVNLGHLWEEQDRVSGWMETLLDYTRERSESRIVPVVAETFPLEHAAEAHHYIQDRRNIGKVLLIP